MKYYLMQDNHSYIVYVKHIGSKHYIDYGTWHKSVPLQNKENCLFTLKECRTLILELKFHLDIKHVYTIIPA